MISKSQFVIFSALLAYQGMVGAPDSKKGDALTEQQPSLGEHLARVQELSREVEAAHADLADTNAQLEGAKAFIEGHAKVAKSLTEMEAGLEAAVMAMEAKAKADLLAKFKELTKQVAEAKADVEKKKKAAEAAHDDAIAKAEAADQAARIENVAAQRVTVLNTDPQFLFLLSRPHGSAEYTAAVTRLDHQREILQSAISDHAKAVQKAEAAKQQSDAAMNVVEEAIEALDSVSVQLITLENKNKDLLPALLTAKTEEAIATRKKKEAAAKKAADEAAAKKADDEAAAKKADDEAAAKNAAPKQAAAVAPKQVDAVAPKKDDEAAAKAAAEEAAKKVPTATTPAAPAVATTEFKTFTAAEAAPIAKKLAEKIFAGDKTKIAEAEKKITEILMLGERLKKAEEKAAPKKQEKTEKKSDKSKKLRRLGEEDKKAAAEKTPDHIGNVIATALKQARHILAQLQQIHGAQLQNVNNQADFTKLEADAKQAGEAISKAEAVIKLREDNTAKTDDLKKAKATVLGLGLGLGLGIPVLVAVVFTVLVKTNRVLLNFGSSATVSADV